MEASKAMWHSIHQEYLKDDLMATGLFNYDDDLKIDLYLKNTKFVILFEGTNCMGWYSYQSKFKYEGYKSVSFDMLFELVDPEVQFKLLFHLNLLKHIP